MEHHWVEMVNEPLLEDLIFIKGGELFIVDEPSMNNNGWRRQRDAGRVAFNKSIEIVYAGQVFACKKTESYFS